MKQPDFGETVIFAAVWVLLLTLSGAPMQLPRASSAPPAVAVVILAYFFYPVAHMRIDGFLFGSIGDTYQTDTALRTLTAGGLFGTGPGAGTHEVRAARAAYRLYLLGDRRGVRHHRLPRHRAHLPRDRRAGADPPARTRTTISSSSPPPASPCQFGMQALINMAVNVQLAPSKGMTLPFICYGGSSMVALSIGMGLLLAFTRRNPYLHALALCREVERAMSVSRHYVLAAGGTGGHMIPAHALGRGADEARASRRCW